MCWYRGDSGGVGLRLTKIRDYDGSLHTIPNSQIQNIKNYNRGPQRAEVMFSVAYDTMLEEVKKISAKSFRETYKTSGFENIFVEKLELFGRRRYDRPLLSKKGYFCSYRRQTI